MLFSTKAEYGVRLMVELGRQPGSQPVSLGSVAEAERLPLSYLEHLVAKLRKAELVTSTRGAHGGYRLAKPAAEITMDQVVEALKAGASGYVLKAQADTDLLAAIRAVERGEPFLTPEAQRTLIKDVLERGSSGEEELTPREEEIVKLVAEAHTNDEIGEMLFISKKTVERHRANILEKLGMRDRVELTRYAIRRGLVEP